MKNNEFVSPFMRILLIMAVVSEIRSEIEITPTDSETRVVGETFLVLCRDTTGLPVTWAGPRGNPLGTRTHPSIHTAIYGTTLVFNKTKLEDEGIYTCSNGNKEEDKQYRLTVEGKPRRLPGRFGKPNRRPSNQIPDDAARHKINRNNYYNYKNKQFHATPNVEEESVPNDRNNFKKTNHDDDDEYDSPDENLLENKEEKHEADKPEDDDPHEDNIPDTENSKPVDEELEPDDEDLDAEETPDENENPDGNIYESSDKASHNLDDLNAFSSEGSTSKSDTIFDDFSVENGGDDNPDNDNKDVIESSEIVEDEYIVDEGDESSKEVVEIPEMKFMDSPQNQEGEEGRDITIRCEVEGGKVSWSVENGDLKDPRYEIIGDGLLIKQVNRTDTKTYICKAVQISTGTVVDRRIKFTVRHKPTLPYSVYAKQEQAWGYVGSTVNLTCEVEAHPPPQFEWFKRHKKINTPHIGRMLDPSSHVSVLQLVVDKNTFGEYKCVSQNELGKLEKYFSLEEGMKAYPPDFIELRGDNSDLLDLGIHLPTTPPYVLPPGMEPIGFNVLYREVEQEDWNSQDFNTSQENSYPIKNLKPDTAYEVQAATKNVAGLSDYTNSSTFRTLKSYAENVHHVVIKLPELITLALLVAYW